MKTKLLFLLPLLALIAACVSKPPVTPAAALPSGTFTGKFTLARFNQKNGTIDSSETANLMLNMETATGFKITGDTTTVHAGSYGGYEVSSNGGSGQIEFLDKTYPTSGTPVKIHLDGIYDYIYDGTNLQLAAYSPLDTVEYFYKFTKTGN